MEKDEHQVSAEEYNSLPVADRIRIKRNHLLNKLINVGFIEEEERSVYEMRTDTLPTDRKGLAIAYYLVGIEDSVGIEDYQLSSVEENIKAIRTARTEQERADLLTNVQTQERISRAEAFVDSKRRRIKAYLQKFFEIQIAFSLLKNSKPTKSIETDPIPYLRDELKKRGYRAKANNLSDSDKKAVKDTATYYLDVAEYAYITLLWFERNARRDAYLNETKTMFVEDYSYENIYDELAEWFRYPYLLLDNAITYFYGDGTAMGAKEYCEEMIKKILADEETEYLKTIQRSKFAYLLEK